MYVIENFLHNNEDSNYYVSQAEANDAKQKCQTICRNL